MYFNKMLNQIENVNNWFFCFVEFLV